VKELEAEFHLFHDNGTHHQERIQLYLQHLVFVTPLLLPAVIVEESEVEFQLLHDNGG